MRLATDSQSIADTEAYEVRVVALGSPGLGSGLSLRNATAATTIFVAETRAKAAAQEGYPLTSITPDFQTFSPVVFVYSHAGGPAVLHAKADVHDKGVANPVSISLAT